MVAVQLQCILSESGNGLWSHRTCKIPQLMDRQVGIFSFSCGIDAHGGDDSLPPSSGTVVYADNQHICVAMS